VTVLLGDIVLLASEKILVLFSGHRKTAFLQLHKFLFTTAQNFFTTAQSVHNCTVHTKKPCKNRVKFGHFVIFSCIYFRAKCRPPPPKVDWAPIRLCVRVMTYNKWVSVDTLRVVRPSLVVWVLPPTPVLHTLAIRLPYTHHRTVQFSVPTLPLFQSYPTNFFPYSYLISVKIFIVVITTILTNCFYTYKHFQFTAIKQNSRSRFSLRTWSDWSDWFQLLTKLPAKWMLQVTVGTTSY